MSSTFSTKVDSYLHLLPLLEQHRLLTTILQPPPFLDLPFGFFPCPSQLQSLFLISSSSESFFILPRSRLLLMIFGQQIWDILRKQCFMNTCTTLMMVLTVLQVSTPYNWTVLTFVLNILTGVVWRWV